MMRACLVGVLLFALGRGAAEKPCPQPVWTVDLVAKYQFRAFGLQKHQRNALPERWKTQEGTVFLSPDVLAVYQVLESHQLPALAPKDASGGGGKFVLQVEFFDTRLGKEARSLRLVTPSLASSRVYPTYDGKFLIKTGEILRLYSTKFEELASRTLPLSKAAPNESWEVAVAPAGKRIYAQHRETFGGEKGFRTERYVLDTDTLQTIAVLNADGSARWPPEAPLLIWRRQFPMRLLAKHEELISVLGSNSLLAAEIHHHRANPFDLDLAPKPARILLYDLAASAERCSIPITQPVSGWWSSFFYAVSPARAVAVIQGDMLSLYQP